MQGRQPGNKANNRGHSGSLAINYCMLGTVFMSIRGLSLDRYTVHTTGFPLISTSVLYTFSCTVCVLKSKQKYRYHMVMVQYGNGTQRYLNDTLEVLSILRRYTCTVPQWVV